MRLTPDIDYMRALDVREDLSFLCFCFYKNLRE